jgi:hypothetical protein
MEGLLRASYRQVLTVSDLETPEEPADASLCAKTFGDFPDFATTCRRDPRVSACHNFDRILSIPRPDGTRGRLSEK